MCIRDSFLGWLQSHGLVEGSCNKLSCPPRGAGRLKSSSLKSLTIRDINYNKKEVFNNKKKNSKALNSSKQIKVQGNTYVRTQQAKNIIISKLYTNSKRRKTARCCKAAQCTYVRTRQQQEKMQYRGPAQIARKKMPASAKASRTENQTGTIERA